MRVSGVLRSVAPLTAPLSGEAVLGYDVACAVFRGRAVSYETTVRATRWVDATLSDAGGELLIALETSRVRAPAGRERTLTGATEITRVLEALSLALDVEPPITQLQVIERCAQHERAATVLGVIDVTSAGAFRTSARPRLVLRGDAARPLVIVPR